MTINDEKLWFSFGIPLAKIEDLDNCPSPIALADAVGDRYLIRHNPVFANIRQAAISFGFHYSAEDTPLWRDYLSASLSTLHRILSTKTIPYVNTGDTLRRLRENNPKAAMPPGLLLQTLKRNFAFHESAHCIAHAVIGDLAADFHSIAPHEKQRIVLESVLAESFANTAEDFGMIFDNSWIPDQMFYSLNSYAPRTDEKRVVMANGAANLGRELTFALLYLASFEANLYAGRPDGSRTKRITEASGCPAEHAETAAAIIKLGFSLNEMFREYTTPAYFEFLGCKAEYLNLASSACLDHADKRRFVLKLIDTLSRIIYATPRPSTGASHS